VREVSAVNHRIRIQCPKCEAPVWVRNNGLIFKHRVPRPTTWSRGKGSECSFSGRLHSSVSPGQAPGPLQRKEPNERTDCVLVFRNRLGYCGNQIRPSAVAA
jgi:hypothetical protein